MTSIASTVDLRGLQTENRNPATVNIDKVDTDELCKLLHEQDCTVPAAVEPCLPTIAAAIDALADRVRRGGRIFYIGAGTSGRLGVLDASEIPPTYSAPAGQFVALIAGGDYALRNAKEGAEDDRDAAKVDLDEHNINGELDSLIGIASSGRTPYVQGGLEYAKSIGCPTVGVVCVSPSAIGKDGYTDYLIAAVTGPESVTGSTRMKAGTATKLVLNMISTGVMIKMGKTYGNLMVDLKATNLKLKERSRTILRAIGGAACTQSNDELDQILDACHGSTKLAAVTIVLKCTVKEAEERLKESNGVLAQVFDFAQAENKSSTAEKLVLCVDAGGSSCKAEFLGESGTIGCGTSGPSNLSTMGVNAAVGAVSEAVQEAIDSCQFTKGNRVRDIEFSKIWIAMAGYDRPSLASEANEQLAALFRSTPRANIKITTDIDLLPVQAYRQQKDLERIIALVSGTGSIAMLYEKRGTEWVRTARVGGWGHLLGDDGSGYAIGRDALRWALGELDVYRLQNDSDGQPQLSILTRAIVEHFEPANSSSTPFDLLSAILTGGADAPQSGSNDSQTASKIASVAKVVLNLSHSNDAARRIVSNGAASLARLVELLMQSDNTPMSNTGLVLSGGLLQHEEYRAEVVQSVVAQTGQPRIIEVVTNAVQNGVYYLAK